MPKLRRLLVIVDREFLKVYASTGIIATYKDVLAGVNCKEGSVWMTALPTFNKVEENDY